MSTARRHHIVALSPDLSEALAVRTAGSWLLPFCECGDLTDLPRRVRSCLVSVAAESLLIHGAPVTRAPDGAPHDHYFVASFDEAFVKHGTLERVSTSQLFETPALFQGQKDALRTALERQNRPVAPFDSVGRVRAALDWAEEHAIRGLGGECVSREPLRCGRHVYMARIVTTKGAAYFKGGRGRATDEARLTQLLWTVSPEQFPCTLALANDSPWWLYRELAGQPLLGATLRPPAVESAVRAFVRLQLRTMSNRLVESHLAEQHLDAGGMLARATGLVESVWASLEGERQSTWPLNEWRAHEPALAATCAAIDALRIPRTLVLCDLWGHNVLATPHGIGFIDLEHCFWSYPWLVLRRFTKNMQHAWGSTDEARALGRTRIEEIFVSEWAREVRPRLMREAFRTFHILGGLFGLLVAERELGVHAREFDDSGQLPNSFRARYLEGYVTQILLAAANTESVVR